MSRTLERYDRILAAAQVARQDYDTLLPVVPDSVKSNHVVLIGQWIDDVRGPVLERARTSADDVTAARWLSLAEMALERVTGVLNLAKGVRRQARRA